MLLRQQPSRYCSGYGCGMAASGSGGYFGSPQASGAYFAAGSGYCSGGIPSSGYGSVPQSPGWNSTVPSTSSPSSSSQYRPRSFSTSSNNGNSPTIVAIDSKIEQAMDLVKTHLMFAVREEVEVLRSKIVDLESHIHHLEAENAVLKEHIPDDILKNLTINKD